jgi:enoyl-CoA hydratase/carnithine racemase
MSAQITSQRQGATLVLTLSNPEHRNALGPEMYAAGLEALQAAAANPDVRSLIITGEGSTFCAGGNLTRLQANRALPPEHQAQSIAGLHRWIDAMRACPKPIIAAVEGAAAGAGFSLVLACDFVVAAQDAVFVMAYSSVALSPDGGGSWHLARQLPRGLVNEMLMLGQRVNAASLAQHGLVQAVCEPGHSLQQALALADRLNARAPNVLASIKSLVNAAPLQDLHTHLAEEQAHFVRNLHHPNAGIGIAAFLNKTPPHYP